MENVKYEHRVKTLRYEKHIITINLNASAGDVFREIRNNIPEEAVVTSFDINEDDDVIEIHFEGKSGEVLDG